MSEDIPNLNDKKNLNPDLQAIKGSVGGTFYKPLPKMGQPIPYTPTASDMASYKKVKDTFFPDGTPQYDQVQKEQRIEQWNNKPEVKNNNIEAIDKDRTHPISNGKFKFMKGLAVLGVIALVIIAGAIAIFAWLAYNDGTLLSPSTLICGNLTAEPAQVTVQPTNCGDCNCPNITCPSINITGPKVYCNQTV